MVIIMVKKEIVMLLDEVWYGLCVDHGQMMPMTKETTYEICLDPNPTVNQFNTVLFSNKGRYIWSDRGFHFKTDKGIITITSTKAAIVLSDGHTNLRGAFLDASKNHFPPNGVVPPSEFFAEPQFNTWIELLHEQTEENILAYANAIKQQGYPAALLMIDACWHEYHGSWKFHAAKFNDPKKMVDKLHQMGFKVMLWTCPFVSPDSLVYGELEKMGCLVKNADGTIAIKKWWYGHSAVLDLTNPKAVEWYHAENKMLMDDYGIDGFKFDAGDAYFYSDADLTFAPTDANGQCKLWGEIGARYEYNEYRAAFQSAGLPLVQRLGDKGHFWGRGGMAALTPNTLLQGLLGYSFTCPDMIGGGESGSFQANSDKLDEELFIRYAQCAALMPMMQFSAAPWRVLSERGNSLCREAAKLHVKFSEYILKIAEESAKTGEPIVRYMEYEFPNEGLCSILDQFMLGSDILVAPVCQKGIEKRSVVLPKGRWEYVTGDIFDGGKAVEVEAPIDVLPYFRKIG